MVIRTKNPCLTRENYISFASTKESFHRRSGQWEYLDFSEKEAFDKKTKRTDLKPILEEINNYMAYENKVMTDSNYASEQLNEYKAKLIMRRLDFFFEFELEKYYQKSLEEYPQLYEIINEYNEAGFSEHLAKKIVELSKTDDTISTMRNKLKKDCIDIDSRDITNLLRYEAPRIVIFMERYINSEFREKTYSIREYLVSCSLIDDERYPYISPVKKDIQINAALYNYDLNMAYYQSLDAEKYQKEIQVFKINNPNFIEIKDFEEVKDLSGIYIMILEKYHQIYIGITTKPFPVRIKQHWQSSKPLDRLIFGDVNNSILSIDSFRHLDTTRILVLPINSIDDQALKEYEYDLVQSAFSKEFIANRCDGGLSSLFSSIVNRKTRNFTDIPDFSLNRKKWTLHELCEIIQTTIKNGKEDSTFI